MRGHLDVIAALHGSAPVGAALEPLGHEQRRELEQVLPVDWVRLSTFEALYTELAHRLATDVAPLHWEIARRSIARNYKTVWRILFRITSNEGLVARTPLFHARAFDTGRLSARVVDPGRAELELSDWRSVPDFVIRHICIGVTTLLELAGRKKVIVAPSRQPDGTLFVVTLEP